MMSKTLTFSLVSLLLLSIPLFGQDSEDDIFAEGVFDAAVAEGKASEDANKLVWLGGTSLASTTNLVLPTESGGYGSRSLFTGKAFLKATNPTIGSLYTSYSYNHTLWASATNPGLESLYASSFPDPDSPLYQLSEFHLSFDVGKLVFLRLGNQLLDWGASAIWSPSDFVNRRSTDPNAALDTRAGKPGLRVHIPFSAGNLFVFADASRSLTVGGVPQDLIETGSLAFKTDTTVLGWNVGIVGNFGKTSDPRLGLTASGAFAGIDLWGELGAVLPLEGYRGTYSTSVGGERSFGLDSEWTLRAEGFWNPDGADNISLTRTLLATGKFTPFYWGKAYFYGELLKKKLLGPDVTGSLSGTSNLSDLSWTSTASLRTTFPGLIPFSAFAQYNGGEQDREFTLGTGSAWTLGIRSILEF